MGTFEIFYETDMKAISESTPTSQKPPQPGQFLAFRYAEMGPINVVGKILSKIKC